MKVYVLNAPVITDYGKYEFEPLSVEEAKELLSGGFVSAVGHEATANALSELLGIEIPVNRIQIKMKTGDMAVVFRVLTRLPEGKVLTRAELEKIPWELGLLTKTG